MSVVTYGVETLRMCKITDFSSEAVFSEDNIDYLYTRHRVTVEAIASLDLESAGITLGVLEARIRRNLQVNRQPLTVYIGERPASGAADQGLADNADLLSDPTLVVGAPDLNAGPYCEHVGFFKHMGTRCALFNATFVAHDHFCGTGPSILSNRWKTDISIDQNKMTRLTLTGRLHANPRFNINADALREVVWRPIPAGFQPESASFTEDSTGLILDYTIVYAEKYQLPPYPFTTLEIDYNDTTTIGAITESELSISAESPKNISKATMLARFGQIVLSQFTSLGNQQGGDVLIAANVGGSMTSNRLHATLRIRRNDVRNAPAQGQFLPLDPKVFGRPIPGSPAFITDYLDRGTAMQRAVAAAWKYACDNGRSPPAGQQANATTPTADNDVIPTFQQTEPPSALNGVSDSNRSEPYKFYSGRIDYETKSGVFTMPLAQSVAGQSGSEKTAVHVRLHQPYSVKHIRHNAERHGNYPEMPKPDTALQGAALNRYSVEAAAPELGADLINYVYGASGEQVVSFDRELNGSEEPLTGGISPAFTMEVADSAIPTSNFRDDLVEEPA